jgi:nickel transport protein
MRHMQLLFTMVILILCFSMPAAAHKVSVFAWVEGETVHTESKFSGGKKVKDGKIEVFDHLNQKVLEGVTDGQGYFAFPVPKSAKTLKVVLTAGMGHSNHWLVTAQELGYENTDQSAQAAEQPKPSNEKNITDYDAIEKIVERAVEKKLAPIRAQLAEQAWGLRDIVSGIGYILGLMGLASYMHHRKTHSNKD